MHVILMLYACYMHFICIIIMIININNIISIIRILLWGACSTKSINVQSELVHKNMGTRTKGLPGRLIFKKYIPLNVRKLG